MAQTAGTQGRGAGVKEGPKVPRAGPFLRAKRPGGGPWPC